MEQRISYRELRATTEAIVQTVCTQAGADPRAVSANTAINTELGVDGDDWRDLEVRLQQQQGIQLAGLDASRYFFDESEVADPGRGVARLLFFLFYLLFFQWLKQKFSDFYDIEPKKEPLTVGDIVASKFAGRFVRRRDLRFVRA